MAYDVPEGTDDLSIAIKTTIANALNHIKSSVSAQHGWSDSVAASCVHKRACGLITRIANSADGDVDEVLSFTPTLVVFHAHYVGTSTNKAQAGSTGYYDGTNNKCVLFYYNVTIDTADITSSSAHCIYACDRTIATSASAVCAFDTNKFTLTWTKGNVPAGSVYIIYEAFG